MAERDADRVGRIRAELDQKDQEQERQKEVLSRIQAELEHCRERRKQEDDYLLEKEKELRESEERYRILTEHVDEGVTLIHDEHFSYVNPAFCALFD